MSRLQLDLARGALAAAIAVKAHIPGDREEEHEDNTFGLPNGDPIRKKLRGFFRDQLEQLVGTVAKLGRPLDDPLPRLSAWNDPMEAAMTPIVGVYWDRAGKSLRSRIGLDPKDWRVTDPNVHRAIKDQTYKFCAKTNATTDLGVAAARDAVRDQIARGLLGRGETVPQLTKRIQTVFARASKSRAELIARTESSRAIHQASIISARSSGVVGKKVWLLSSNACPRCKAIAARFPDGIPVDSLFGIEGHDADYSQIYTPPLHPDCRCTLIFVLSDEPAEAPSKEEETEKEKEPAQNEPGSSQGGSGGGGGGTGGTRIPRAPRVTQAVRAGRRVAAFVAVGSSVPAARLTIRQAARLHRQRKARRDEEKQVIGGGLQPARPEDKPLLKPVPEPIPAGPIGERIQAYMAGAGKAKLERLANLDATYQQDLAALEAARIEALKSLDQLRKRKGHSAEETQAVDARVKELSDRREAYQDTLRRNATRVAEALAIPSAERALISTRMTTKGRAVPAVSRQAEGWLGQVLAADPDHPKGIEVEYGAIRGAYARAEYVEKNRRINLSGAEPASTIVHEFGHAIEHQWPSVGETSSEFLDHRVQGEKLRKLKEIFPKRKFHDSERGRKDKFGQAFDEDAVDAWYCGKEYRHVARNPKTRYATEILSMGLEKLMKDPVKFAKKDPEFCAYILGILDGSLR